MDGFEDFVGNMDVGKMVFGGLIYLEEMCGWERMGMGLAPSVCCMEV